MRITLTYTGELIGKQKDALQGRPNKTADHVHDIRKRFHAQLKEHWCNNPFLSNHESFPQDYGLEHSAPDGIARISPNLEERQPLRNFIPDLHKIGNYRFLPLVRSEWKLQCELDILFLRKNPPGSLIQAGDIDNRIKTLLDALRMAQNSQELGQNSVPEKDENPFYCLLEDDQLVSRLNIETDRLLEIDEEGSAKDRWVKLVVRAQIKPIATTTFNLSFA
ncbi:hypothetical protein [Roseovarius sp.]|uniref:hypothetical protein n=1 Tax=Roseovarius sp. TaxID=1486281 RepID=UPI003D12B139